LTLTLIQDLLIILTAGFIACLVCRALDVSVLVGYLIVGVLIGSGTLGLITDDQHQVAHVAEAGVFLLLFAIGLEFSLDEAQQLGSKLYVAGATQMLLVAVPMAFWLHSLGVALRAAILIAAAISFSSTVLVFKALSEQGQSETRHGRRAIGILLFQDAALVPLLLLVPLLSDGESNSTALDYLRLAIVSLVFVGAIAALRTVLGRWLIPAFARYRSAELVILFTVVVLVGITLTAYSIGLPPAVGAFAAGLVFNGNRWTKQIDALVMPFRETFAAIFFVSLGLILDPRQAFERPWTMALMIAAVIVIKAVAGAVALRITGLSTKQSIGMGIGLAHVGEFAFVLMLLGYESGVITQTNYQQLIGVAVTTLIVTPTLLKRGLRIVGSVWDNEEYELQPRRSASEESLHLATIIGAGPSGRQLASRLETNGHDVCLVDLSPINLHAFAQEGFRTIAGDATLPETLKNAKAEDSDIVVVCIPEDSTALRVIQTLRGLNQSATLIVRCRFHSNVSKLKRAGADRVVSEEFTASVALLDTLQSTN
jgi:CPA2 family monovalent cation:H+ antiporter-2